MGNSGSLDRVICRAEDWIYRSNFEEADKLLTDALRNYSQLRKEFQRGLVLNLRVLWCLEQGLFQQARNFLRMSTDIVQRIPATPPLAKALLRCYCLYASGSISCYCFEFPAAEAYFKQVIEETSFIIQENPPPNPSRDNSEKEFHLHLIWLIVSKSHERLARLCIYRSQFPSAEMHLQNCRSLIVQGSYLEQVMTGDWYMAKGILYHELEKYDKSWSNILTSKKLYKNSIGKKTIRYGRVLRRLARLECHNDNLVAAQKRNDDAVKTFRVLLPEVSLDLAICHLIACEIHLKKGDLASSETSLATGRLLLSRVGMQMSSYYGWAHFLEGKLHLARRNYPSAQKSFTEHVDRFIRPLLGERVRYTGISYFYIGLCLKMQNFTLEANEYLQKAYQILEEVCGPTNERSVRILHNLASLHCETGDFQSCLRSVERAAALVKQAEGRSFHPSNNPSIPLLTNVVIQAIRTYQKQALANVDNAYSVSRPTGKALVINNSLYHTTGYRYGSDVDFHKIQGILTDSLGLETDVLSNLNARQMVTEIERFAASDFSKFSLSVVVILSHGVEGQLVATDDKFVPLNEKVIEPFYKSVSLEGKPKLFFVQCCRGNLRNKSRYQSLSSGHSGGDPSFLWSVPLSTSLPVGPAPVAVQVQMEHDKAIEQIRDERRQTVIRKRSTLRHSTLRNSMAQAEIPVFEEPTYCNASFHSQHRAEPAEAEVIQSLPEMTYHSQWTSSSGEQSRLRVHNKPSSSASRSSSSSSRASEASDFSQGSDLVIGYATIPRFKAVRDPVNGSWFIHALFLAFQTLHPPWNFDEVMKFVNIQLAHTPSMVGLVDGEVVRQTACWDYRLTKRLVLPARSRDMFDVCRVNEL